MSPTATMTSQSYQRPRLPPAAPPTIPLPPLPMSKTRKVPGPEAPETPGPRREASGLPSPAIRRRSATASPTTATVSRIVTPSGLPTPRPSKTASSPVVPTLRTRDISSSPALPASAKSLRRTVSIENFPQPPLPHRTSRLVSLPPSPLSTSVSLEGLSGVPAEAEQSRPSPSPRNSSIRRPTSTFQLRQKSSNSSLKTLSLLNNASETRSVSSGHGKKGSESLLNLPSASRNRPDSSRESLSNEGSITVDSDEYPSSTSPRKASTASLADDGPFKDGKGNVVVSVRVRPDANGGDGAKVEGEWMVDGRRSLVSYKGREGGEYVYDNVFSAYDNNSRVYDSAAKRLVRRVMEGYNGTVFAYGMTGTGKTFSMQGTAQSPGVIPLAITDIFSYIRENPDREFLLRVSYLEIYNEKIFDLLSLGSANAPQQDEIKLREDKGRIYATPLKEEIVQSPNQLLRVIARGDQARKVAGTQFNARSSRSHAVVQIVVESRERTGSGGAAENHRNGSILPGGVLVSTLSLIDLAGSEKAAENKERRTEGAHINKSLLTLGTVIGKLAGDKESKDLTEKDQKHLPYRDSKLTRLLQPALSGGSLVSILCTIQLSSAGTSAAAASSHTGETLNTLKFASRAKNNIVSHAKRNMTEAAGGADAGSRALLDRYRLEILELRSQLDEQSKPKEEPEPELSLEKLEEEEERWRERRRESEERHEEQMLEMHLARTALKERISHLNRLILSSKSLGVNSGRFSNASIATPLSHRGSTSSAVELVNSRRQSGMSSASQSSLTRTVSAGSATVGIMPSASTSQIELASASEDEDAEADSGESMLGRASKSRQIRTLQADLSDKNRYIATLEKRLVQARRSSHSKASTALPPQRAVAGASSERDADALIREKDREMDELRAKLDDQIRMVTALRSAARKREMLDGSFNRDHPAYRNDRSVGRAMTTDKHQHQSGSQSSSRPTSSRSAGPRASHASQPSTGSSVQNFSRPPMSPPALDDLTNGSGLEKARETNPMDNWDRKRSRRSVDEMTQLLNDMIQEEVDDGQIIPDEKGGLRVKRDTVIDMHDKAQDIPLGAAQ